MKNLTKNASGILAGILTVAMLVSPAIGLANNGKNDKDAHEIKSSVKIERTDEKSCFKAFGRFFFGGFIHTSYSASDHCYWPFGKDKFGNGNSTTTPDTIAPVITNASTTVRVGEAVITWDTDENSDSRVFFSTTSGVNAQSSSTPVATGNKKTKNHKVVLGNLTSGATYYAIVSSKDNSGNTSYSSQFTFTTKLPDISGDTKAPVIRNVVTVVSTSTIQVAFRTNEFTTAKVYYSLNSPVNATSSATYVEENLLRTDHVIKIPNLSANTKYYLLIEAKDYAGNVTKSTEYSYTTHSI